MAYPQRSDFASSARDAAWFGRVLPDGSSSVCHTEGWNLLEDVQITLRDRLEATGPLPSFGGSVARSDTIRTAFFDPATGASQGDGWNAALLAALYAVAREDRAPASFLAAVQVDAQAGRVSAPTVQTALWEAYLSEGVRIDPATGLQTPAYGLGSPAWIQIPSDAILPTFGVLPPVPSNRVRTSGLRCRLAPGLEVRTGAAPSFEDWVFNPWAVAGLVGVAAVGAILLTRRVPTLHALQTARRRRR